MREALASSLNGQEVVSAATFAEGDRIELIANDGYGQPMRISQVVVGKGVLKGSLVESIERVIALQIENE